MQCLPMFLNCIVIITFYRNVRMRREMHLAVFYSVKIFMCKLINKNMHYEEIGKIVSEIN